MREMFDKLLDALVYLCAFFWAWLLLAIFFAL